MGALEHDYHASEYRYDMSEDEVRFMTAALLQDRREKLPNGEFPDRYVCMEVDGRTQYANIGRQIEREVFEESFGNDASEMMTEYGPYEEHSRFFITIDTQTATPTGVLRVIENSENGLKTLNDVQDPEKVTESKVIPIEEVMRKHGIENLDKCDDVGTVAVPERFRGPGNGGISIQLYRAWYVSAQNRGVEHVVSMIDKKPLSTLRNFLGIPFKPLAGRKDGVPYLGSGESYPVYGHVPDFYDKMNRGRLFDPRKIMARKVLRRLMDGESIDHRLMLDDDYKN
jgi:hypothetical protein